MLLSKDINAEIQFGIYNRNNSHIDCCNSPISVGMAQKTKKDFNLPSIKEYCNRLNNTGNDLSFPPKVYQLEHGIFLLSMVSLRPNIRRHIAKTGMWPLAIVANPPRFDNLSSLVQ